MRLVFRHSPHDVPMTLALLRWVFPLKIVTPCSVQSLKRLRDHAAPPSSVRSPNPVPPTRPVVPAPAQPGRNVRRSSLVRRWDSDTGFDCTHHFLRSCPSKFAAAVLIFRWRRWWCAWFVGLAAVLLLPFTLYAHARMWVGAVLGFGILAGMLLLSRPEPAYPSWLLVPEKC